MPDGEQITPKNNFFLLGQEEAEKALLGAYNSNKLHNSWLISGVKGIGKATLAYRFARFLLDERGKRPVRLLQAERYVRPSQPRFEIWLAGRRGGAFRPRLRWRRIRTVPQTAWFLPVLIPISKSLNAILSKPTAKKC